jgi:regulatory protein
MTDSGSPYFPGKISNEKALQKLKHFCGYQERSHGEVKQKLYSMGFFKKDVEELTGRLIEEGYLNEQRFANLFASGKHRIKGWGKQKIRHELRQKGIGVVCIEEALKFIDEGDYQNAFSRQAAKKWKALQAEKNIFVRKGKWQQFLLQRGFEAALIKTWTFPQEDETGPRVL